MSGAGSLRVDIFTIFPEMFAGPFDASIVKRARDRALLDVAIHNLRDWTTDRHRSVDDVPYGGGAGMVMMAPPILAAVEDVLGSEIHATKIVVLSAAGRRFSQPVAHDLSRGGRLALICGRYEGIDDRVTTLLRAEEITIGDYVLTGGELPAMVIVDAVTRLLPGVIEDASVADESHNDGLIEYPHFTRPADVRGLSVPEVLLSGHHARIAEWRRAQAIQRTALRRPDLLAVANLTETERQSLAASRRRHSDQP